MHSVARSSQDVDGHLDAGLARDVIHKSVTPDDVGHHARMLDLLQRRNAPNGLNAGEEVLLSRMKAVAGTAPKWLTRLQIAAC